MEDIKTSSDYAFELTKPGKKTVLCRCQYGVWHVPPTDNTSSWLTISGEFSALAVKEWWWEQYHKSINGYRAYMEQTGYNDMT
tara:strand:+ start:203 stop:451 length:249 start_codon:yes stop_codon:yes gene_type:complete